LKKLIYLSLVLLLASSVQAGTITRYFDYSTGDSVTAVNLNGNFNNIQNEVNGALDNNNADTDDGFRFIEVLDTEPAAGNQGRVIYDNSTNLLKTDTGTEFRPTITYTGTATKGDIGYFNGTDWTVTGTNAQGDLYYYNGSIVDLLEKDTNESRYLSNQGTSNNPQWEKVELSNGANINGMVQGDVFFASSPTVISRLPAGTSAQVLHTQGAGADAQWAADDDSSNVVYQYVANVQTQGTGVGEYSSTTLVPNAQAGTYRFMQTTPGDTNYDTVFMHKWKKIPEVNTWTVYGQIWQQTAGRTANLKVDVGGSSGNASGTGGQVTPEWVNFTVNVSGLSDGTVYDVTISVKTSAAGGGVETYLGNLIAFGS